MATYDRSPSKPLSNVGTLTTSSLRKVCRELRGRLPAPRSPASSWPVAHPGHGLTLSAKWVWVQPSAITDGQHHGHAREALGGGWSIYYTATHPGIGVVAQAVGASEFAGKLSHELRRLLNRGVITPITTTPEP